MENSIDLVVDKIVKTQGKEGKPYREGTIPYEFRDKEFGLRIESLRHNDGNSCNFVEYEGRLVYLGRTNNGKNFKRERYEKGDWEEKLRIISRQATFPF